MKVKLFDPFAALSVAGGATFEPHLGFWSQVDSLDGIEGEVFEDTRDAIYIPTVQKTGSPVPESVVQWMKSQAQELGLCDIHRAAGMWILSDTGEVQSETIWIAEGQCSLKEQLPIFAVQIRNLANQDCVAWEQNGELFFTESSSENQNFEEDKNPTKEVGMNRAWIIPQNDLEAVESINLLHRSGERVFISQQAWGASWENLESEIVSSIEEILAQDAYCQVIGVELSGTPSWNALTIDHHAQGDREIVHESSLEQVACMLGEKLNRYQELVAINDRAYITGMVKNGASQGEITAIRQADRCAQGVSPDQEAQAIRDLDEAQWLGRKVLVNCESNAIGAYTDRLFGQYDECLLVMTDKCVYFGARAKEVHEKFKVKSSDWLGNQYAGFVSPSEETQAGLINYFKGEI